MQKCMASVRRADGLNVKKWSDYVEVESAVQMSEKLGKEGKREGNGCT